MDLMSCLSDPGFEQLTCPRKQMDVEAEWCKEVKDRPKAARDGGGKKYTPKI